MKDNRTVAEKKEEFLQAFKGCLAIKTLAARKAKIGRTMLYDYINTDPEFAVKVQEVEEAAIDFVESLLKEKIFERDRASIMFFLKAKAKSRGYH